VTQTPRKLNKKFTETTTVLRLCADC